MTNVYCNTNGLPLTSQIEAESHFKAYANQKPWFEPT